ncbi:MAG TPA: TMEM175 family protein [Candidatus Limnocylindrales bacterium]|nr:TMEM175 family protein [Candidatus Limnocylindrales bacterium]
MAETQERETGRVEAFSDGVFAIAITLLVLEFKVPHRSIAPNDAALWASLRHLWPSFIAFIGSFAAILIMWISHHGLFRMVRRVDTPFLYGNGLMLLMITFVPFPTAVLAEYLGHPGERAAAALYCGTFVLVSITFQFWWWTVNRRDLLKSTVSPEHIARIGKSYRFGFAIYIVATALAFWKAALGLGLCLFLWFYWAMLSRRTEA